MTRFRATNESEAAERSDIWAVLTDQVLLVGVSVGTAFTERMRFEEGRRIDYTHQSPKGVIERTGAEGSYELSDVREGTHLAISLTCTSVSHCPDSPARWSPG